MQSEFWDARFADAQAERLDVDKYLSTHGPTRELLRRAGDVYGRRVLDLGCGAGHLSVLLAQGGADVLAIDTSKQAVSSTLSLAKANGVSLHARRVNALFADRLGKFDLIIGKYILHHIEPFDRFANVLSRAVDRGGRGLFFENSARNRLLMLARKTVAGRFGVARYSDDEEHPLCLSEVQELERYFDVNVHYPWMVCMKMINVNVLRGRDCTLSSVLAATDDWVYDRMPVLRRYSYHQIVEVRGN